VTEIGENTKRYSVSIPDRNDALELSWGVATDIGHRRQHNEDSFVAAPPLFAVADGMGGHSAGDLASAAVVKRLAEAATGDYSDQAAIERALGLATEDIGAVLDESSMGVGTTVTGAALVLVDGAPHWSVFNVGDSRVYLVEHGAARQITVDHSVVQELVDAGMISARDAESHPDSNIITRAVGFNADCVPDFWTIPVRAGMRLVLCSDGLTKELDSDELTEALAIGAAADEAAATLVRRALDAGGRDNVTVVVIDVIDSTDDSIPIGDETP
jgi:serine/threonine protein phosphatase PrpC